MLNVQFSDSSGATIIGYFGAPQAPTVWENMGTVEASDARWKTYYDSQPAVLQPYLPAPT
jgi:hypothetical protein